MATVYLHNNGIYSDEFQAAESLKEMLEESLSQNRGQIWIIPSVDVHPGTGIHDLDILMMGYLEDYQIDICGYDDISINSFCATIEVKSHGADGIYRNGQDLYVRYPNDDHNVTWQSKGQRNALMTFLEETLQYGKRTPFISNVIWLTGIDYEDFEESVGLINSNIVTCDATVEEFFDAIGRQYGLRNQGFVDSFKGYTINEIKSISDIFCAKSDGADTMTLRRLNLFTQNTKIPYDIDSRTEPVIVLSGHAGTGKTIMLLQAADILTKKGKKCLFLTYNNALISDLQHTISIISRSFSRFEMKSMHAFLISILYKQGYWKGDSNIEKDFLPAIATLERTMRNSNISVPYDYVFVDEAQDWEKSVAEVLKYICRKSQIVIADGIDQFMHSDIHTDWGKSSVPILKKCLRQRRNLTVFARLFANKMGVCWNVEPNTEFHGGKVIVTDNYDKKLHDDLMNKAKMHGCTEYDLMYLVPPSLIENGHFKLKDKYEQIGMNLYDGTNPAIREVSYGQANAQNKECRVFSYESCRGLEAWTVVCHRFNELFDIDHPHSYKDIPYDVARKYMLTLWTLIPLTRAIDRLVIVVQKTSPITEILKEIAIENPDIVEFNIK